MVEALLRSDLACSLVLDQSLKGDIGAVYFLIVSVHVPPTARTHAHTHTLKK